MTTTIQQLKEEIFKDNRISTSKYYLLYIDILGMKNKINSEDSELYLNYINNLYRDAIKAISLVCEGINNIPINIRIFSDNLVVAIPEGTNEPQEAIKRTLIIEIASYLQMLALKYSLLLRGSITYGDFYIDNNFLYGKALTRAYHLESEIAIYPRIIIDDNFADMFLSSNYLYKFIKKDTDDIRYIDTFDCYFNVSKIYKQEEIQHLRQILWTKLPENNSCKVNQKIHWLVNRFNEFCTNNKFENCILDVDKIPRLSNYVKEAFEGVATIEQ